MSTDAFERAHGFGDGMVSKVQTGKQTPSLQFVDALVREAQERIGLAEAAAEQIIAAYGRLLGRLAADPAAKPTSTMHKQMLQLFEAKMALRAIAAQVSAVTYELVGVREQLRRLQEDRSAGRSVDDAQENDLLTRRGQLEQQHRSLLERRGTVLADVDQAQYLLAQTERSLNLAGSPGLPASWGGAGYGRGEYKHRREPAVVGAGGAYPPQPPYPPAPPPAAGRRFALALAAVVVAVIALGSVLITTLAGGSKSPQDTAVPPTATSRSAPPSPTTAVSVPPAPTDPAATAALYTDSPFTLRGANLECVIAIEVNFNGQHPAVSTYNTIGGEQAPFGYGDLFYSSCRNEPSVSIRVEEQLARITQPPSSAQACQAAAEQNPTALSLNFSRIKPGDKFCLVTSRRPTVVYLQVVSTDASSYDIHWKATAWEVTG